LTSPKSISPFRQELKRQRQSLFRNGRYWFHVLIWLLAFLYMSFAVFGDFNVDVNKGLIISSGNTQKGIPMMDFSFLYIGLLSIADAAIMVYTFLLIFIPYARYKKRKVFLWIGLISNIGFWFATIMVSAIILGYKSGFKEHLDKHDILLSAMLSAVFSGVVVIFFFALYYFIDLYDQQKHLTHYKDALKERIEAETAFLLNQINPHFLFNTLNNIYSLLLSQSSEAVFVTKELQHMMQYMLEECNKDRVSLSGEITFLKNYINLEKLRNQKNQIQVQFMVKGEPGNVAISPLLLINFLENAFKHGVKAGFSESYVHVTLEIKNHTLIMEMENSKPPALAISDKSITEEGGIGIVNVRRRLDILYPNRYKLNIQNNPNEYLVLLSIDLKH
jgi:two-component system LytT family sensor kinase